MPVSYDGKKLIPAPQIEISKEYLKSPDGKKIGSTFNITIEGTMVPHMGSPNSEGTFHTANGYPADDNVDANKIQFSLFKKTEAIRDLFSIEGKLLKIGTWHDYGSTNDDRTFPAISGYARVNSINFPQSLYNGPTAYSINLELDELMGMGTASNHLGSEDFRNAGVTFVAESGTSFSLDSDRIYLSDVNEDWSIEDAGTAVTVHYPLLEDYAPQHIAVSGAVSLNTGQKIFTVTHNLSAVGKRVYGADGLIKQPKEWAQKWIIPQLCTGQATTPIFNAISGIADSVGLSGISSMGAYDYVRSVQEDSLGGSYSVSETWTLSPVTAIEDVDVETSYNYDSDIYSTSINGTIRGFETRNCNMEVSVDRYQQALNYFANSEAYIKRYKANYGSVPSNYLLEGRDIPTSKSISKNPTEGTISYSFTFEDRADNLGVGAISENITIQYTDAVPRVAALDVPGRNSGPVIQDLGTKSVASVTIGVDATVKVSGGTSSVTYDTLRSKSALQIQKYIPSAADLFWITADTENWDPWTGKYTRSVTYQYQ